MLGAIFAVVLAIRSRSRWTTKGLASSGVSPCRQPDVCGRLAGVPARSEMENGLHLGFPFSTKLSCALFVATLFVGKASTTGKVLATPWYGSRVSKSKHSTTKL